MFRAQSEQGEIAYLGWRADVDERYSGSTLERLAAWLDHPETTNVEEISRELNISQARLLRMCRAEFGFAPKYLMRRARFVRMLKQLQIHSYREWRLFLDPRYVDQSHFIRDFHFFLGMAPSDYMTLSALQRSQTIAFIEDKGERRMAA